MGKLYSLISAIFLAVFVGYSAEPICYEYWFDSDYSNKTSGQFSEDSNTLILDVSSPPHGAHYFNCRVGYGDGNWGSVYRKMVLNLAGSVNAAAYEYWIDDNYSLKTEGRLSPGANSYIIDLDGVRKGLHRFNYRLLTGEGVWGTVYTQYFYVASNKDRFTQYEYWLDNDYENRVSATAISNPVSFDVDLRGFDKNGPHYFHLRARDDDGDWSPIYRKLLIFNNTGNGVPIIGYRHYINGSDLGYVEVERQITDSYMFDINLPDSLYPSVKNRKPIFDGDKVSVADADSIDYVMHIRTELGWSLPQKWRMELKNDFSTSAVEMKVNTKQTFTSPSGLEFAAVKFTSSGDPLYLRSDVSIALDIYKDGDRVEAIAPAQLKGMTMLQLEEGEYFGILYGVEDAEAKNFTLHLMDTPNIVPMPEISFEDGIVTMTCSRSDAEIRYTLDGTDPTEESLLYSEAFALTRNAIVKAKAFVSGSDIDPSIIAELIVDSYKTATPTGVFDIASRTVTLSCATEGASLSYTFVREGEWIAYTAPITITRNCTLYAKASFEGYNDSDIAEIVITELANSVADPKISFADGLVTITCENSDAEIHYTVDGTEPTAESQRYSEPFSLLVNGVVKAVAFVPGLDIPPSGVSQLVVDSYKTATPTGVFDMASRTVTLLCATEGASLSYTLDREGEWIAYTAPIAITRNCNLYAKASFEGYNDSDIAEIVITELANSVADPKISFADGVVTITCENSDAEIHYTVDGTEPTADSPKYSAPFSLLVNGVVKAFAFVPGLDIPPSGVSQLVVDSYKTATPTGVFDMASRTMTLSCATEGAEIIYRIGVAGEWTAYTAPFTVGRNCTVYAKAVLDGYNDSEIAEIPVTGFPDSMPQPIITFSDGMVTMACERSDAEIRYTLDGTAPTMESTLYEGPFPLSHNATVWAFAYIPDSDIEPSEISELVVDSYRSAPVAISYNGRYVTMNTDDPQAEIRYSIILPDGVASVEDAPYTGEFDVNTLCHVKTKTIRDGYQDSEESDYAIDYYGDESHAETNAGGLLKSAFAWCESELINGIGEFRVEGTLNDDDYSFLKSMEGLRHLDIEKVAAARIPDNAFKGTRLISISMPADITEYGDSILSDCDRLSGVIWNSKMMDIESRLIDGISNPNVLLYVSSEVKVENQDNHNVIVDDVASSVILHDEYPFDVAREFMAEKISFTRNFDMETLINGCSGWESIVLPFSPDSIVHERAGRIVPFSAWEKDEFADFKPFWLYKSNSSGWEEVESMEACVPYIISMPNNEAYVRDFNIAGNVSFVASDITLTPESASPESTPWVDGTQFIGTFMPVEESDVRSLNVNGEDDRTPGSAFVEEATTKPFDAYIAGAHRRYMPVFESSGALLLPSLGSDGLKVYSPAPGTLKISSNCRRKVSLTTITGVNLRTILLSAGETVTIEGLTRDIYMVGGIKVTVR